MCLGRKGCYRFELVGLFGVVVIKLPMNGQCPKGIKKRVQVEEGTLIVAMAVCRDFDCGLF